MLNTKTKEWLKRYGLAEALSFLFTLLVTHLMMVTTRNSVVAAFVGTWTNNAAFYGLIVYRDMKDRHAKNGKLSFPDFLKQLRNCIVEFGPAEYLDSFLIRPFYLWLFPRFIHDYTLAIFIGTILADVSYFIPTIISYELRKKVWSD